VLLDLADQFPLLAALVDRHAGSQRVLRMGGGATEIDRESFLGALAGTAQPADQAQRAEEAAAQPPGGPGKTQPATPKPAPSAQVEVPVPATRGPRRPARFGLSIRFEERPDDPELARLVESTVLVNEAHPAYRRAAVSRSEGYHIALATAMALAPLAVEPAKEHAFVTAFLASWGMAVERLKGRRLR
jgi:hypothetical protein